MASVVGSGVGSPLGSALGALLGCGGVSEVASGWGSWVGSRAPVGSGFEISSVSASGVALGVFAGEVDASATGGGSSWARRATPPCVRWADDLAVPFAGSVPAASCAASAGVLSATPGVADGSDDGSGVASGVATLSPAARTDPATG